MAGDDSDHQRSFCCLFLGFGNLESVICIAIATRSNSRLCSRVSEPQGGKQWKGLSGFPENVAKMIHPKCTVSSTDTLFLSRGHSAVGHRAPVLTGFLSDLAATHCRLFFVQDGGCNCPGDVAKAFGKDSVSWHPRVSPAPLAAGMQESVWPWMCNQLAGGYINPCSWLQWI